MNLTNFVSLFLDIYRIYYNLSKFSSEFFLEKEKGKRAQRGPTRARPARESGLQRRSTRTLVLLRKRPHSICYSRDYYAAYSYSWHLSKIALATTLLYNGQVLSRPYARPPETHADPTNELKPHTTLMLTQSR